MSLAAIRARNLSALHIQRRNRLVGRNLLVNGTFSDSSGWTLKSAAVGTETMTISGGTLNLTGDGTNSAYADQSFTTVIGTLYVLTFTVSGNQLGSAFVGTTQGGTGMLNQSNTGTGTISYSFVATATTSWLRLGRTAAGLATIDNVSVRAAAAQGTELVTNGTFDSATTGWTVTLNSPTLSVVSGKLRMTSTAAGSDRTSQPITTVVGKTYRYSANISAAGSSANISVSNAAGLGSALVSSTAGASSRTDTVYFTATATTTYVGFVGAPSGSGQSIDFDNATVKEVTALFQAPI